MQNTKPAPKAVPAKPATAPTKPAPAKPAAKKNEPTHLTLDTFVAQMKSMRSVSPEVHGVVVFAQSNYAEPYDEKSRSYRVGAKADFFNDRSYSKALPGECLDGSESIDVDYYLVGSNKLDVEHCYIEL